MIRIANTKALISCAVLCFCICKKLFSHNEAHFSGIGGGGGGGENRSNM